MGKLCQFCKKSEDTEVYHFAERAINWNRTLCRQCANKWVKKLNKYKGITMEELEKKIPSDLKEEKKKPLKWWQKLFRYFEGGYICD